MSLDVLKEQLKENRLAGVYVFTGEEDYLKKFYVDKIKKAVGVDETDAFNYFSIASEDLTPTVLDDFFLNGPVFADRKLMYISCFDSDDTSKLSCTGVVNALGEMKDSFPDWSILVINQQATESPVSKSFAADCLKALGDCALEVKIEKRSTAELTAWILRHAKAENVEMDRSGAEYLLSVTDNGMYNLSCEMAKLFGASNKIDRALIDKMVIKTVDARIFDLTDALMTGNVSRAMTMLHELWDKEQETVLMGSIYNSFTRMYSVKLLTEKGLGKSEIAEKTGMKPFVVGKTMDACRSVSLDTVRKIISDCAGADDNMKRFAKDKKMEMDLLILRIISHLK